MVALFLYLKRRDVSETRTAEGGICKKEKSCAEFRYADKEKERLQAKCLVILSKIYIVKPYKLLFR